MISFSKRIFGILNKKGELIKKGEWDAIEEIWDNQIKNGSLIEIIEEKHE